MLVENEDLQRMIEAKPVGGILPYDTKDSEYRTRYFINSMTNTLKNN